MPTLARNSGARISDGTLGNAGEVNAEGTFVLHHRGHRDLHTFPTRRSSDLIDGGSAISNAGTLQANGGELDLSNDTLTNSNALKAINNSILELKNGSAHNLTPATQ